MICSMTGYGRAQESLFGLNVTVEMKSVNSRYFEFNCRLPRGLMFLEDKLKTYLSSRISRGKIEMFVSVESENEDNISIELNTGYLDSYISALNSLSSKYKIKNKLTTSDFVGNNDAFVVKKAQLDEESYLNAVMKVAEQAVDNFIRMRQVEGAKLADDISSRIDLIREKVSFIEEKSPKTVAAYRERLENKIKELLGSAQFDDSRIITETAVFADKVAVDEETVRIRSHMDQLVTLLKSNDAVGRKSDFIVQEMNREANTIGSKAQDLEIAQTVVDIKAEIEKIREQVQNIE